MQKYNVVNYYEFPLKTVVTLLMESKEPIYDLVDLPNVSTSKLLEERDEGDKKYIKNEWCVHGQIPKIAQKVIRPEMLTFIEDSIWDRTTNTYMTKIIPHFFKQTIDARHKLIFTAEGNRTKRVLTGVFEMKIPIIGPVFEAAIMSQLKQNFDSDFKMSNDAVTQYVKKFGDPCAEGAGKKK